MRKEATKRHKAVSCDERVCRHRAGSTRYRGLDGNPISYELGKGSVRVDVERQSWESQGYEFGEAGKPVVYVHRDMAASNSACAEIALRGSVRLSPIPCTYTHAYISMLMHAYTRVYPQYVGSRPTQFCYSDRCV